MTKKKLPLLFFLLTYGYVINYFGKLKQGKTYVATKLAIDYLLKGCLVISNYPIHYAFKKPISGLEAQLKYHPKCIVYQVINGVINYNWVVGLSSVEWDNSFFDKDIHGEEGKPALVVLDEAHREIRGLSGMQAKETTENMQKFFQACEHNLVNIILISHSITRYGPFIREVASQFCEVRKISNFPGSESALYFTVRVFETEEDVKERHKIKGNVIANALGLERIKAKKEIYKCYDYHFFRNQDWDEPDYQQWPAFAYPLKPPLYKRFLSALLDSFIVCSLLYPFVILIEKMDSHPKGRVITEGLRVLYSVAFDYEKFKSYPLVSQALIVVFWAFFIYYNLMICGYI